MDNRNNKNLVSALAGLIGCFAAIFIYLGVGLIVTGFFVKIICWCFGIYYTFKLTLGVWAVLFLISMFLKGSKD